VREVSQNSRGDLLVQQILDKVSAEPGALANDLLSEFWRGYPIDRLRPLLRHPDTEIVETGAFLADELPGLMGPLMDDVVPLMDHPSPDVRFLMLGAVLDNVVNDGEVIARAMLLVHDPHSSVRWTALRFVLRADQEQLESAVPFLPEVSRTALEESGLLDRQEAAADDWARVRSGLNSADELVRRWAAAAAARFEQQELLSEAVESPDPDVSTFADHELKMLIKHGPRGRTPR